MENLNLNEILGREELSTLIKKIINVKNIKYGAIILIILIKWFLVQVITQLKFFEYSF